MVLSTGFKDEDLLSARTPPEPWLCVKMLMFFCNEMIAIECERFFDRAKHRIL